MVSKFALQLQNQNGDYREHGMLKVIQGHGHEARGSRQWFFYVTRLGFRFIIFGHDNKQASWEIKFTSISVGRDFSSFGKIRSFCEGLDEI